MSSYVLTLERERESVAFIGIVSIDQRSASTVFCYSLSQTAMAEAIISSLFHVIFEKLSSQMFDEYGFLQGTKKEMRKLHSVLSSIQSVFEDAEDRNIMNKAVNDWLIKLKDVAYDADDLLDDYVTEDLQRKMEVHDLQGCIMNTVCHFFSQSNPTLSRYACQVMF